MLYGGVVLVEGPLTLLMTETSREVCRHCQAVLPGQDIELYICPRNGTEAYSELVRRQPDAVLLDLFMPGMDAFALKEKYNQNYPNAATAFYVMGTFQRDDMEKEVMDSGFAFYFMKPFDIPALAARLKNAAQSPHPGGYGQRAEDAVTEMLRTLGVPAHIKGYRYLRDAILLVVQNPALLGAITKELYPAVAAQNETSPTKVERAIRHGIEVAWSRGNAETIGRYFSTASAVSLRSKPTNSEFIAVLGDRVSLAQKNGKSP